MRYYIIGAGGTGGAIGGFLSTAGKDVTFVVRKPHLDRLRKEGLSFQSDLKGPFRVSPLQATTASGKTQDGDVVFVSVKSYDLDSAIPIIENIAKDDALVIPVLNPLGAREKLAAALPHLRVMEGRIYINAFKDEAGIIHQQGKIFKVIFGPIGSAVTPDMEEVAADLVAAGIKGTATADIQREAFRKFAYISPYAATGAYYRATAKEIQDSPEMRDLFTALSEELIALGHALKIPIDEDQLQRNIQTLEHSHPDSTASLQKDLDANKRSEVDGLIGEVLRLGKENGVSLPNYQSVALALGLPEGK